MGRGGWISEKLFEINGIREENIQSPPPYVHFVVKFPSFTGAKLLSLSTLLLPLFPASPFIPFLADPAAARARHSPLPYNRLINQYNIFTERDSSERYCQYRETLSKASNEGREGGRRKAKAAVPSLFPPPSSLSHSRTQEEGEGNSARSEVNRARGNR